MAGVVKCFLYGSDTVLYQLDSWSPSVHTNSMRLSEFEKQQILHTAREYFGDSARVSLFGSRVDNEARGGDIDLLICTDQSSAAARTQRVPFLVQLKRRIGDRRIDVVIQAPDSRRSSIHQAAASQGVEIQ